MGAGPYLLCACLPAFGGPQLLLNEYLLEQNINKMAFANGLEILLLAENKGNVLPFSFSTKDSISSTYGEPS